MSDKATTQAVREQAYVLSEIKRNILVSELYGPVIQGEGQVAGQPTVFLRLGGCDYRCSWCDSLYAVLPEHKGTWTKMTADQIMVQALHLAGRPVLITLSGGNPALHNLRDLIELGHKMGFTFAIETQGSRFPEWAPLLDSITISPKPPSSRMTTNWSLLKHWIEGTMDVRERCIKVVVFNDEDYAYARKVWMEYAWPYYVPMYLQAGTIEPYMDTGSFDALSTFRDRILVKTDWLGQKVIADQWYDVRVLPQIHALLYGAKRGV